MNRLGGFVLLALLLWGTVFAQESGFRNPTTGFVFDASVSGVRAIGGFPGASLLGEAVVPAEGIKEMQFAPGQSCALGVDTDGRVYVMKADPGFPFRASLLEGVAARPSKIHFNRSGSAALLYFGNSNRLQVVTGLPNRPVVSGLFEVPDLAGEASAFALDDSGERIAIGVTGQSRGAVYLSGALAGQPLQLRYVASVGATSALTFSGNGKDLAVADKTANTVFLVKDVDGTAAALPVAALDDGLAEPSALEFYDDTTLLIINSAFDGLVGGSPRT